MELVFAILGLAMLAGYGTLLVVGMAPEQALGFMVGGGLVIGIMSRVAIAVLTSSDLPNPTENQVSDVPTGGPRSGQAPIPGPPPHTSVVERA